MNAPPPGEVPLPGGSPLFVTVRVYAVSVPDLKTRKMREISSHSFPFRPDLLDGGAIESVALKDLTENDYIVICRDETARRLGFP